MKITQKVGQQIAGILRELGYKDNYGTGKAQAELVSYIVTRRASAREILTLDDPIGAIGTIVEEAIGQFGNWSAICQALEKAGHMPQRAKGASAEPVEDLLD